MAGKGSFSRYQSYTTQKKQREQILRIFLMLFLVYAGYLVMGAVFFRTAKWSSVTMEPTLTAESSVLLSPLPFGNTNLPFLPFGVPGWRGPEHGELVQLVPPYHSEAGLWVSIADDFVRFVTLQMVSVDQSSRASWDKAFVLRRVIGLPGDTIKIDHYVASVKPKGESYFLSEYELSQRTYSISQKPLPAGWRSTFPLGDSMAELTLGADEYFVLADNRSAGDDSRTWGVVKKSAFKASALLVYWPFDRFGGL